MKAIEQKGRRGPLLMRTGIGVGIAGLGAALVAAHTPAVAGEQRCRDAAGGASALSCTPVAPAPSWPTNVLDAGGPYVRPKAISVDGDAGAVDNPDGLLAEGGGAATVRGGTRIVVDLGQLASGYVELGVARANGANLRMAYAEARQYLGTNGDADSDPDDFFYNGRTLGTDDDPDGRADVFRAPAGSAVFRSPGLRGSQRWIAISLDGAGSATLDFVRIRQTNRQGAYDGHFLSSDPVLNRAWYTSAYGLNLSTIRDRRNNPYADWAIIDGPKRDRVVYAGDLELVAQSGYYQDHEFRAIVRNTINLFACQQRPDGTLPAASRIDVPCDPANPGPPDGSPAGYQPPGESGLVRLDSFTALWVVQVADYLRYTGDAAFATAMLPVARRAIEFFPKHAPDGVLWRTDTYDGKPGFNWHPPDQAAGIDAYGNEVYYAALRAMAELERNLADDETAKVHDARADQVRDQLIRRLWDPKAGAMLLNTEDPKRDHGADANVGALRYGLLNEQQARSATAFLRTTLATPYGTATSEFDDNPYMTRFISPYILAQQALGHFRYNDGAAALTLIRTAWGHLNSSDPGTPWEQAGADGTPGGVGTRNGNGTDLAHAWSNAIPALTENVIGAKPAAAGYREWTVAPNPVDLRWAQGDVPTPAGTLSVRWQRGAGDTSFTLTVEAPRQTRGSVAVPLLGTDRTIAMDGQTVWKHAHPAGNAKAHRDGDTVVFNGMAGSHTFAWVK